MRKISGLLALLFAASPVFAGDVYVNGYTRSNGTYVAPHMQTAPDSTPMNNYSTRGNINPYTGQEGKANPYATPKPITVAPAYEAPRQQAPAYEYRPIQAPQIRKNGF